MSHNLCPCCQIPLSTLQHMGAHPMLCSVCRGLFFTEQDLISSFREAVALLKTSTTGEGHQRVCPQDQTVMTLRRVEGEGRPIELDHCGDCGGVWFDGDEVRQVRAMGRKLLRKKRLDAPPSRPRPAPRPASNRAEKAAVEILEREARLINTSSDEKMAAVDGKTWLFGFLTKLPLEGHNPVYRTPLVTWTLIVLCCLVFVVELSLSEAQILALAFSGENLFRPPLYVGVLLTHMFMHGGLWHLFSNMYFLKVFGDNVEDRLGPVSFGGLYLACGLVAALTELLVSGMDQPMVGASGAIGGILGAYLMFFPDVRISIAPSLLTLFRPFPVRAVFLLPIWLLLQLLFYAIGFQGVAFWAHIGGFLSGMALAWLLKDRLPDARIAYITHQIRTGNMRP